MWPAALLACRRIKTRVEFIQTIAVEFWVELVETRAFLARIETRLKEITV
jgi:hypothetical protein